MKIALYRQYRPQNFQELLGQEAIQVSLQRALEQGHLSHALLFCGPRGTGKTSTARIVAKAIQCLDPQKGEACGLCSSCIAHEKGQQLDLIEIDAASNRGIDEIRSLRESLLFPPSYSKKKVYIIDEVHMLTKEAFNALLKSLEEPPAHAMFILATTEKHKIPETILSRCQRYDFKLIDHQTLKNHLLSVCEKEKIHIEEDALEAIVHHAQGGMRDALSILSRFQGESIRYENIANALGLNYTSACERLFHLLQGPSLEASLLWTQTIQENGLDVPEFLLAFLGYIRQSLHEAVKKHTSDLSSILGMAERFEQAWQRAQQSPIPALALEIAVIQSHELKKTPHVAHVEAPKQEQVPPKKAPVQASVQSSAEAPQYNPEPQAQTPQMPPKESLSSHAEWNELRVKLLSKIEKPSVKRALNTADVQVWTPELLHLQFDSHFHKEQCAEAGVFALLEQELKIQNPSIQVKVDVKEKSPDIAEAFGWPTSEEYRPPQS